MRAEPNTLFCSFGCLSPGHFSCASESDAVEKTAIVVHGKHFPDDDPVA